MVWFFVPVVFLFGTVVALTFTLLRLDGDYDDDMPDVEDLL
jgi:hypothetical protein